MPKSTITRKRDEHGRFVSDSEHSSPEQSPIRDNVSDEESITYPTLPSVSASVEALDVEFQKNEQHLQEAQDKLKASEEKPTNAKTRKVKAKKSKSRTERHEEKSVRRPRRKKEKQPKVVELPEEEVSAQVNEFEAAIIPKANLEATEKASDQSVEPKKGRVSFSEPESPAYLDFSSNRMPTGTINLDKSPETVQVTETEVIDLVNEPNYAEVTDEKSESIQVPLASTTSSKSPEAINVRTNTVASVQRAVFSEDAPPPNVPEPLHNVAEASAEAAQAGAQAAKSFASRTLDAARNAAQGVYRAGQSVASGIYRAGRFLFNSTIALATYTALGAYDLGKSLVVGAYHFAVNAYHATLNFIKAIPHALSTAAKAVARFISRPPVVSGLAVASALTAFTPWAPIYVVGYALATTLGLEATSAIRKRTAQRQLEKNISGPNPTLFRFAEDKSQIYPRAVLKKAQNKDRLIAFERGIRAEQGWGPYLASYLPPGNYTDFSLFTAGQAAQKKKNQTLGWKNAEIIESEDGQLNISVIPLNPNDETPSASNDESLSRTLRNKP